MMLTLARIPFFKDAGDIEFDRFDRRCTWRRFEENEVIVDFEDTSSDVYFILTGEARVLIRTPSGKEIILADMKAAQFFGELSAIDGVPRSANVTALTRTEVCIMPATVFREVVYASRTVCDKVLRLLTSRIRESNARLTEHSVFDIKHRLYPNCCVWPIRARDTMDSSSSVRRRSIMFWRRASGAGANRSRVSYPRFRRKA